MKLRVFKKFIPQFIWRKIEKNPELQKIVANINWLFFDKAIQMAVAFFVGVWVIRYLGPERYGTLSYAIAFVAFFGVVAKVGMDNIAVREFVKKPEEKGRIFGTLFVLKFFAGIIAFISSLVAVFFVNSGDALVFWLIFVIALGFVFQASDVFDFWFQSQVKSKYSVYVRSGVNILSGLIKIGLILSKAPLIAFAWVLLFGSMATFFGMIIVFLYNYKKFSAFKVNVHIGKKILADSWPLILSGIAITIYSRIDQIMIGNMLDNRSLGYYSAAVSLSEIWSFFPVVIAGSVFPAILYVKNKQNSLYIKRLQILYDFMFWSALIIAVPVSFFSKSIVYFLYGANFSQSATVVSIYVWAEIAVFLGVASSKFLIAENLTRISFYRTAIGAVVNVILNLILIPRYGISGAALATLISYFIAVFSIVLFKKSRINLFLFLNMFNILRIFRMLKNIKI